jgi:hypothetical protein
MEAGGSRLRAAPFARDHHGIVQLQCVMPTAPAGRCDADCRGGRQRERFCRGHILLPRAYTYEVVSCRAGAASRRNREGLAREPPLEGHDNARVLTHSHHPIGASSASEKIESFAHPLWFWKPPRDSLRGKVCAPAPGQQRKAAPISTQLGLACSIRFVDRLHAMRGPGDSHSDVILRLVEAERPANWPDAVAPTEAVVKGGAAQWRALARKKGVASPRSLPVFNPEFKDQIEQAMGEPGRRSDANSHSETARNAGPPRPAACRGRRLQYLLLCRGRLRSDVRRGFLCNPRLIVRRFLVEA